MASTGRLPEGKLKRKRAISQIWPQGVGESGRTPGWPDAQGASVLADTGERAEGPAVYHVSAVYHGRVLKVVRV